VTVYTPWDPLQDSVEVPEPVTLVGVRVQVKPVAGETVAVRETIPLNPFRAVTVTVDVPEAPARIVTVAGLAAIVKSWTVKVTVAEWDIVPLVPVTVTVYVPALPVHESVEVWAAPRVTVVGVRVQVRPVAGVTVAAKLTVPVKPWSGVTVIVEVPEAPARAVTAVGLAVTV